MGVRIAIVGRTINRFVSEDSGKIGHEGAPGGVQASFPDRKLLKSLAMETGRGCDTEGVFHLKRPTEAEIARAMAAARAIPVTGPEPMTLESGRRRTARGFAHDESWSEIGRGERDFAAAREALRQWTQFDLGWVFVGGMPAVAQGEMVAVVARACGLWSVNVSRIVETVDRPVKFGFVYATTAMHVEEGQERFVVEMDAESGAVSYRIEALSRPRHPLVWAAYPLGRAMQHRFARESHARMQGVVARKTN